MRESFLKKRVVNGVFWSTIERFSVQGIQFILTIIIARLVEPSEYGLIAMLGVFLSISQVFIDSGFSNALIQKKERTEKDFSTVFYFNIVIALIVYAVIYISAPYISEFYREPLLLSVTRWIGLFLLISAFSIVQRAKLTINLDFKTQAKSSFIAVVTSGFIGIVLAYNGYGVWALVFQTLSNYLLNTLILCISTKWIPQLVFSWDSFRGLFSFGSKLLLSSLLHSLYINLYSLVIGRKYSAMDVGYYNRAFHFASFPSINIVTILSRVIYPIQCQLQNDDERLTLSFIQYLRMSCYIIFPLMIGLAILAKPLVVVLLTEKWIFVAELLSILCVAYMWYPVMVINNQMLNVKGRSDYFLKAEIVKKITAIIILFVTIPLGIKLLCWGIVFYNILDAVIIIYYVKKVIHTTYVQQIRNIYPSLSLSVVMGVFVFLVQLFIVNAFLKIILGTVVGVIIYMCLSKLFKVKEFNSVVSILKRNR